MALKYTLEEAVAAWRLSSKIAAIVSGRLSTKLDHINVSAVFDQKNLAREESIKNQHNYVVTSNELKVIASVPAVDISTERMKAFSPVCNTLAIIREVADPKASDNKPRQCLEIWKNGFLWNSWDFAQFEKHGRVYTDGTFGCFEFSPDAKYLVYLAEKKDPKKQSFLKFGLSQAAEGMQVGTEYSYVEDWGEQLVGKSQPVICVYEVGWEPCVGKENPIQVIDPADEFSPGQLTWFSNDQLVGVGWFHEPRRMGLIYCSNRPSKIFRLSMSTGQYEWFGSDEETAAAPRCHLSSKKIVYLKSKIYGPHHKEQKLVVIDSEGVRTVETPIRANYRGMYNQSFIDRCWSPDGQYLIFSTPCNSFIRTYVLNLKSAEVSQVPLPPNCTSGVVLDVLDNVILLSGMSSTQPDDLYLGRVDFKAADGPLKWTQLTSATLATSLKTDLETFQCPDETEYESLLVYRNAEVDGEKMPLIVYPHGGPHGVSADQFRREVYFFNHLSFAVLFVNYRGSTGFGDKSLNTLLGKVGTQDVQEVHQAAVKALEKHSFLDPNLVFLCGGSHGGFLVTHLCGQYPDFYKAVSARNPVIDMATMFPITDIADWTIVESQLGQGGELEKLLNPGTLSRMWEMSPIRYVDQVKAPVLLLVGKVDLRVPPTQAHEYYRALKVHGKKVKLLQYDDCHPLGKLPVDVDGTINTVLWYKQAISEQ